MSSRPRSRKAGNGIRKSRIGLTTPIEDRQEPGHTSPPPHFSRDPLYYGTDSFIGEREYYSEFRALVRVSVHLALLIPNPKAIFVDAGRTFVGHSQMR